MEGPAFFWLAITEWQRNQYNARYNTTSNHHHKSSYQHRPLRETELLTKVTAKVSTTIHKVTDRITKSTHLQKMPSLRVLYVPADPEEGPQFVRLARKGITRTVVFLHPNGELYKFPNYKLLKGYERDCGPSTAPVFGGKRACEGGCCGWFSTDAEEGEVLDYVLAGERGERPKHDIFLVRHGDVETTEARFLEEGFEAIRSDGRGWLGRAKIWQ